MTSPVDHRFTFKGAQIAKGAEQLAHHHREMVVWWSSELERALRQAEKQFVRVDRHVAPPGKYTTYTVYDARINKLVQECCEARQRHHDQAARYSRECTLYQHAAEKDFELTLDECGHFNLSHDESDLTA